MRNDMVTVSEIPEHAGERNMHSPEGRTWYGVIYGRGTMEREVGLETGLVGDGALVEGAQNWQRVVESRGQRPENKKEAGGGHREGYRGREMGRRTGTTEIRTG